MTPWTRINSIKYVMQLFALRNEFPDVAEFLIALTITKKGSVNMRKL